MKIHVPLLILLLCVIATVSCSGTTENDRGAGQENIRERTLPTEDYLVPEKRYTTNGLLFQKKHRSLLLDLIEDVNNIRTHQVREGTVGFYYDKKTNDKNRLYFGYDLSMHDSSGYPGNSYTRRAKHVIRNNLEPLLEKSRQIHPVLAEDQVMGLVMGFYWQQGSNTETVTAWVDEQDLLKYHGGDITFNECMVRSIYTDQQTRIIRLLQ